MDGGPAGVQPPPSLAVRGATAANNGGGGRARAGTMPSTFHLMGQSAFSAADSLLSPSLHDVDAAAVTRPDLLRRRLSGLPLGSSSSINNSSNAGAMSTPQVTPAGAPLAAISSILRDSQPVSPDPVAAARLRSGSLTLPPSGLGNAFTPGVFGPPGSFTPRSSGLGTPLAMPTDGAAAASSTYTNSGGPSNPADIAATVEASSPDGPQASAILDFLGLQDGPGPSSVTTSERHDQTRLRSPSQPPPVSSSASSLSTIQGDLAAAAPPPFISSSSSSFASSHHLPTQKRTSPPGTAHSTMSAGGLLVPARLHSGSLSVPSSSHPSIANLRQVYQDHGGPSSSSGSSHSSPDGQNLSPATAAARIRANTLAADPLLRNRASSSSSAFHFSPSLAMQDSSSLPPPSVDPPSRTLADLSLEVEAATAFENMPGAPIASSSAYLLNRPRASTFSILDESAGSLAAQNRKRAGTTAAAGLLGGTSLLRTPLYEGGADGYMASATVAETEEVGLG